MQEQGTTAPRLNKPTAEVRWEPGSPVRRPPWRPDTPLHTCPTPLPPCIDLVTACRAGAAVLEGGGAAMQAVTAAIKVLEVWL